MPKFSILTPVHLWNNERVENFIKCVNSVRKQSFKDFEWVVIDDGSTVNFLWDSISDVARVIHQTHNERVIAYNKGFEVAEGEWIIFLDSDDELLPKALKRINKIINKYPEYSVFNFGCVYHHKDGTESNRGPFVPAVKDKGHEIFGGGNIVNGTFVFKKDSWNSAGGFPKDTIEDIDCSEINYGMVRDLYMGSPYDFSAYAQIEFPEIRQFFMVNHEAEPQKIIKELGNPWGQDYYAFYKLTRKFHSKPIDEYFYKVNTR